MSINLTVQEAIVAKNTCEFLKQKTFSAKVSFKLIKLLKELEVIKNSFEEAKNATILRYGKKDDEGQIIKEETEDGKIFIPIASENIEICNKELLETLEQKVEISDIYFYIKDFEEEKISPEELIGLFPFILE